MIPLTQPGDDVNGPDTHPERPQVRSCALQGCAGQYERREITHTVRHHGRIVVIDHVPAEVCSACGDVLFWAETVRRIEALLRERSQPARTVPLYEYA
jgi:YgiT-type zinc finger domain-containing protein